MSLTIPSYIKPTRLLFSVLLCSEFLNLVFPQDTVLWNLIDCSVILSFLFFWRLWFCHVKIDVIIKWSNLNSICIYQF